MAASVGSSEWIPSRRFSGLPVFGSIRMPSEPFLYPAVSRSWFALAGSYFCKSAAAGVHFHCDQAGGR